MLFCSVCCSAAAVDVAQPPAQFEAYATKAAAEAAIRDRQNAAVDEYIQPIKTSTPSKASKRDDAAADTAAHGEKSGKAQRFRVSYKPSSAWLTVEDTTNTNLVQATTSPFFENSVHWTVLTPPAVCAAVVFLLLLQPIFQRTEQGGEPGAYLLQPGGHEGLEALLRAVDAAAAGAGDLDDTSEVMMPHANQASLSADSVLLPVVYCLLLLLYCQTPMPPALFCLPGLRFPTATSAKQLWPAQDFQHTAPGT